MRAPRRSELQLMASLRDGPKPIATGPIGRGVKRGWCGVEIGVATGTALVLYRLTEAGRLLLDATPEASGLIGHDADPPGVGVARSGRRRNPPAAAERQLRCGGGDRAQAFPVSAAAFSRAI